MNLPRSILQLVDFASNPDVGCPNLERIQIRPTAQVEGESRGVIATTTNGHHLAEVTCPDLILPGQLPITIPAAAAKAALKGATRQTMWALCLADTGRSAEIIRLDTGNRSIFAFDPHEEGISFPDSEQVIPKKISDTDSSGRAAVWGINVAYLADVATYLKRVGWRSEVRVQTPYDALSPLRCDTQGPESESMVYVLMPTRI